MAADVFKAVKVFHTCKPDNQARSRRRRRRAKSRRLPSARARAHVRKLPFPFLSGCVQTDHEPAAKSLSSVRPAGGALIRPALKTPVGARARTHKRRRCAEGSCAVPSVVVFVVPLVVWPVRDLLVGAGTLKISHATH